MRFMHGAAHASLKPTAGPRRHRKSVDAKYAKEKKRERKELRRRGKRAQTLAINVHCLSSSFRLHPSSLPYSRIVQHQFPGKVADVSPGLDGPEVVAVA